ncbi:ABC transporter permease [soil metagenome]
MLMWIVKRILATLPVFLGVAIAVFSLLYVMPGDPASIIAGDNGSEENVAAIRAQLGLDQPYMSRLLAWLAALLQGDLGTSLFTQLPVMQMIGQRLGPTLSLAACAMVFSLVLAIPLGVLAAWKSGSTIDRGAMLFAVLGFSIPSFVLAYVLIFVLSVELRWLPVQGYMPPSAGLWTFARHLVLPGLALGLIYSALLARVTRASMLEVLQQDFVRTARAKGVPEWRVLLRHALGNAGVPIVTVVGLGVSLLLGGVIVIETVFAIPGIGRLTVDAILRRDYPIIQAVVILSSGVYMVVNLLVDVAYGLLDPRVTY